jgi:hypothetical protein
MGLIRIRPQRLPRQPLRRAATQPATIAP